MPVFQSGSVSLNLGIVRISGQLTGEDRQCAWRLYTEMATRLAVRGRPDTTDFSGEVIEESLNSLHKFFLASREIMKDYPVGRIGDDQRHLGFFVLEAMEWVLRPFLEKWQSEFRHFWASADPGKPPFERQEDFAKLGEMKADWANVRAFFRASSKELADTYKFPDVLTPAS